MEKELSSFTPERTGGKKPLSCYPQEIQLQAGRILYKLTQFGFGCAFTAMDEGPILRSFYFDPTIEAVFSRVLNKGNEVAGALSVEAVRVYRDSGLLVVEVPRADRQTIRFDACIHEMMKSPVTRDYALPLLLGQDPKGKYLFADLHAQPHMLMAGSTGSGKSVTMSEFLGSMALLRTPRELELTLVDTKNLDLVLFRSLEHVQEVVTDAVTLQKRLEDLLIEVRHRTQLMSGLARNVKEYNANFPNALSYKVLVIDELADVLELDAARRGGMERDERADTPSIASLIKRITQISRAAGIHLIMATQRPSVKMVTGDPKIGFGDIKANFPARICFKLPSMADSRVVLDENGAEDLLGKGDYLYKLQGIDTPQRAHSAFVTMEDIALILSQHEQIRMMYTTA